MHIASRWWNEKMISSGLGLYSLTTKHPVWLAYNMLGYVLFTYRYSKRLYIHFLTALHHLILKYFHIFYGDQDSIYMQVCQQEVCRLKLGDKGTHQHILVKNNHYGFENCLKKALTLSMFIEYVCHARPVGFSKSGLP